MKAISKSATIIVTLIVLMHVTMTSTLLAQNNAHVNWDLLNKPTKRALWVWKPITDNNWDDVTAHKQLVDNHKNAQDNLIDFCKNKSINTLYVFVGSWEWDQDTYKTGKLYNEDGYASLIQKANAAGIRVWALFYFYDNANDFTDYANITTTIVDAIGGFNQRHPSTGFDGIQSDNEPSSTPVYTDMIDFCKLALQKTNAWKTTLKNAGAKPFVFSAVVKPAWVTASITYKNETKEMYKFILDNVEHVALMDYYDTQAKLLNLGIPVLSYAASLNPIRPVSIGIETGWKSVNAPNTYNDEILAETNLTRFNKMEDDLDMVEATFKTYKSYERIAIHDLAQYYALWFGLEQGYWLDANPTWGNPPFNDLMNDASQFANWPNLLQTNAPPIINSSPIVTGTKDISYTYTVAATDANNDVLTYSASVLPAWLNFNPTTRLLSGTPSSQHIGKHTVTLDVSDGTVTTKQTFTVAVSLVVAPANLLVNGSFETTAAWDLWAGAISTSCSRTGTRGVLLSLNEAGVEQKVVGLKPLTRYAFNGYVNSGGTNVGLGTKSFGGPTYETICNSTVMTQFTKIFTTGDTNTSVIVYLYRIGNTTPVCADDFEVIESPLTGMEEEAIFKTLKVYPNPSSSVTQVDFELKSAANTLIALYNMQGQKVTTLLEAQMLEAGTHHQTMATNDLAEGVYYLSITINSIAQSVKLVILNK
ncbi:MAG: hypothetical protein RL060_529 [Bacteroidota bacterium]|jgi:hypothetical protein